MFLYAPLTCKLFNMDSYINSVVNADKFSKPSDDDYMNQIQQYKNESWYNRLLENPFLYSKQPEFSPNFFQRLLEGYEDFTARDRYYADLLSRQQDWLSNMLSQMHEQDYNSASQQASRMKQAGINPDLNGGVSAGEASENDQAPLPSPSMGADSSQAVNDLSTSALGFLSGIMNLGSSFQNIRGLINNNIHQELSNNNDAMDLITKLIAGQSTFTLDDINSLSDDDFGNEVLQASSKIDYSPYSPPTRRLIKSMFGRVNSKINGHSNLLVSTLRSKLRKEYAENQRDAVKASSHPLFDEDFDKFLRDYSQIIGDAEFELQKSTLEASKHKADYDSSYFHNADPVQRAKAENKSYSAEEVTSSQSAIIEGMWNDVYELCKKTDSWYGTLGLVLIPFLRNFGESFATRSFSFGKAGGFSQGAKGFSSWASSKFGF